MDVSSTSEEEAEGHIVFRSSDAISSTGSSTVNGVEQSVLEEQLLCLRRRTIYDDLDVVHEIKLQFESASKTVSDISKMLEVENVPYYKKKKNSVKRLMHYSICCLKLGLLFLQLFVDNRSRKLPIVVVVPMLCVCVCLYVATILKHL